MAELMFNEEKHLYTMDGVVIPSVTQIMQPLSAAHYKGVDDGVLAKAAEKGTAVHESAELYLRYQVDDCPAEYHGYMDGFIQFVDEYKPEVIDTEKRLYHPLYRYAGTADLLCKIDGKVTLIDYKTTVSVADKLVRVQLEAYAQALAQEGVRIEQKGILHLSKEGKKHLCFYPAQDAEAWRVFGSLKTIYDYSAK